MEDIKQRIAKLKKELGAVILAHNYQRGEIQDIADFSGDSLGLAQQAAKTDAKVIVFCGVHFMAETAAITCPDKTVIIPDPNAGCPMANMLTVRELRRLKDEYPGCYVVCYVNSTAAVKAESDCCCTSSNAVDIIRNAPKDRDILFVPDQSLGAWAASKTGRTVHLMRGYCPTHHRIRVSDVQETKAAHPEAPLVVHPECTEDVIALADHVASTGGICAFAKSSDAKEIIVGTEIGLLHRLRNENPDKTFYPASDLADCPNMKLNNLEKIMWAMEDRETVVTVDEEIAAGARRSIERMLEQS